MMNVFFLQLTSRMSEENNNCTNHVDWSSLTGDVIVCCGGYEGRYQIDNVEAYNVNERVWVELPSMPLPRDSMAAGTDGKVIVLAGGSDRKNSFDDVMIFDWQSKKWSMSTAMPSGRAYAASAMDSGRLLVAGGSTNVEIDTCEAFDLKTEKWQSLPSLPGGPRARSGGALMNNHFFVVSKLWRFSEILFLSPPMKMFFVLACCIVVGAD